MKESLRYDQYGKELLKFSVDLKENLYWAQHTKRLFVKFLDRIPLAIKNCRLTSTKFKQNLGMK